MKMISAIVLMLIILFPCALHSATIRVPADQPTLRAGIEAAGEGDTVLVADGVYSGPDNYFLTIDNKNIVLCSENGPDHCIIDCQSAGRALLIQGAAVTRSTRIEGFTFTNGFHSIGGAILCVTDPTITNCVFVHNSAEFEGGALLLANGSPLIENCTFIENEVSGHDWPDRGGAIMGFYTGEALITGNRFESNRAGNGGALYLLFEWIPPLVNGNVFTGNVAEAGNGGALWIGGSVGLTLEDDLFESNRASGYGGGLFFDSSYSSELVSNGNRFFGNQAGMGGGGAACNNYTCSSTFEYCLFTGNESDEGGALYVTFDGGLRVYSSTITGNHARNGGGVLVGLKMGAEFRDSIIWGNEATSFGDGIRGEIESSIWVEYCDLTHGDNFTTGEGVFEADPLFVHGPLGDYYLSQTGAGQEAQSPCVDTGKPSSVVTAGTTRSDSVQDGHPLDLGFHFQAFDFPCDLDGSGRVDGVDLAIFGRAYGRQAGDGQYDEDADFDGDGVVDGDDLAVLASFFGQSVE